MATVDIMVRLVRTYKTDSTIRQTAIALTDDLPPKHYWKELHRIFKFVRDEIRYIRDVEGIETVQTPVATLEIGAGDCDDKTTLLCALLASIGFKTRFFVCGFDGQSLTHVFVQIKMGGKWVSADPIMPYPLGWRPPNITNCKIRENGA